MTVVRHQRPTDPEPWGLDLPMRPGLFGENDDIPLGVLLRGAVRAVWRHRRSALVTAALVSGLVGGVALTLPPTYVAAATVLIRTETQGTPSFLSGVAAVAPRTGFDSPERRLETEMQLAASRPVIEAALDSVRPSWTSLYRPPLAHVLDPALRAYEYVATRWFGLPASDRTGRAAQVETVQRGLAVTPVKTKGAEVTSNLIAFELKAADRETARVMLDAMVHEYLALQSALTVKSAREALTVVTAEQAEASRFAVAARERLRASLAAGSGASRAGGTSLASSTDDLTVDRLKSRVLETELALADARGLYFDRADTVLRLQRRLATLQTRLRDEMGRGAAVRTATEDLEREVRTAELREEELSRKAREIELLTRSDALLSRERLIVEEPRLPRSSDWKKRAALVVVGVGLGLAIGLMLAGLSEALSRRLGSADAARRLLGAPPLASLPHLPSSSRASLSDAMALHRALTSTAARGEPRRLAEYARGLEILTTRVVAHFENGPNGAFRARSIMVTSARPEAGKSTVASGLAATLRARSGQRVLLMHGEPGRSALVPTPPSGHTAVVSSGVDADVGGQSARGRLATAAEVPLDLTEAGRLHDWIVLDAATVGDGTVEQAAQQVDLVLLVVDARHTGAQVVADTMQDLHALPGVAVTLVLNHVDDEPPAFLLDRF